jgi:hypothetical protein
LGNIEEELEYHYKQKTKGVYSTYLDHLLKYLEAEHNKHPLAEEERWCQKSRAIWIQSGDKNTKFFHRFASHKRNKKHIWEIKDENGMFHTCQEAFKEEASRFFNTFFQYTGQNTIEDQIAMIRLYPKLVTEEEVINLEKPCSREELLEVLKGFSKDKSLGPDG